MERQLHLIEADAPDWRLDERTRQLGARGVARARAALQAAARNASERNAEHEPGEGPPSAYEDRRAPAA